MTRRRGRRRMCSAGSRTLRALLAAAALAFAGSAAQAQGGLNLSLGADYAQGKYGTAVTSKQWTVPLVAKHEAGTWSAKVTLPYVRIENPAIGRDGTPLPCAGSATAPRTASGLGDLVVALSRNVLEDRAERMLIDLTGKVKLGTADETKCLGTGEDDFYVQGDLSKGYGSIGIFGTLGWRKMGDPPGVAFKDPLYYSIGGSYRVTAERSVGLAYDYRQPVLSGRDPLSEATLFVSHRFDKTLKLQGYAMVGFSDSSPDWAIGAVVMRGF